MAARKSDQPTPHHTPVPPHLPPPPHPPAGPGSLYPYTGQLLALKACSQNRQIHLPEYLAGIVTPLIAQSWKTWLERHQALAKLILRGMEEGFRVSYDATASQLRSGKANLASAAEKPEVIDTYLQQEAAAG